MDKIRKARKDHECSCCDAIIQKGTMYQYEEGRIADYDEVTEEQNGILFFHAHFCNVCYALDLPFADSHQ